ncbi:ABC transporter permease [Thermostaphylospora chromogena]|uniref:Osmoprotectant transport system permease protein n=1 Tax=Thermostaphylospora chromogena TaxID=35622 RepID=A0A1H1AK49_9ACTN|nr:ABC transporter permease [Thermostaphylospora chromogena]SDQ39861.1 osmoprotectant transport system permease protein [Thermostaphylospora chromogena]
MDEEPLIRWDWIGRNWNTGRAGSIWDLTVDHIIMSGLPVILSLLAAVPIGLAAVRWRWLYQPTAGLMNVIYALPSLPVFMLLIPVTGLERATVVIPLTFYGAAVLIPAVVEGITSIPEHVRQSAVAAGFTPLRRLLRVELVLAMPVVLAGLRVVAVSSISLVSIGALIGQGGLGNLFTDAFKRDFPTPAVVGITLIVLLALVADGLLIFLQRVLTPWTRAGGRA